MALKTSDIDACETVFSRINPDCILQVMRPSTPNSKKPICMPGRLFPATLGLALCLPRTRCIFKEYVLFAPSCRATCLHTGPGFRGVRGKNANNGLEMGSSESNSSNEGGMYVIGNEHGVGVALGTVFASGSSGTSLYLYMNEERERWISLDSLFFTHAHASHAIIHARTNTSILFRSHL